jgi:DNA-binding response OmpR family regulator
VPAEEEPRAGQWAAGKVLTGRALLVEDEDQLRDLAACVLEEAGLEVATACDAETAAAVAEQAGPFDVLVTDEMLPGGSGLDLARALGAGRQGFPALFVTACTNGSGPAPQLGPDTQVLPKPYRSEELVFTVAALLGSENL